jgi:phosphoribosylglycinamide formyltransferase-1
MKFPRNTASRYKRIVEILESFPDVETKTIGRRGEHRTFLVRKKVIAYYLVDHHGDGRIALWCKAAPGEQSRLVEEDPRRFFIPPYLGPRGWVGVRLDLESVDWAQVAYLARNAYRVTASRAQIARME